MAYVVTFTGSSASTIPGATTTAQTLIDCVGQETRQILGSNTGDVDILLRYIDKVSHEMLRRTRWRWLLSPVKTFNTSMGVTHYVVGTSTAPIGATDTSLGLADIFTIKEDEVFDRTNYRQIYRVAQVPLGQSWTQQNSQLSNYRNDVSTPDIIELYPPPAGVYAIEFRYYKTRTPVTVSTQVLQIPDDYKDVLCAGVCMYAFAYLEKSEDALRWGQLYQAGLTDIIRDSNLPPRVDFMRIDYTGAANPLNVTGKP